MFNMQLVVKKSLEDIPQTFSVKKYDVELDDGRSVIYDICEVFSNTGEISFFVSGFGQKEWPVDCLFDLSSVIEQLPEIITKVNDRSDFILDFYEQGIEREVRFAYCGDHYVLTCKSRTDWNPEPDKIRMKKEDVRFLFMNLYNKFIELGNYLCPDLTRNKLLKNWLEYGRSNSRIFHICCIGAP